MKSMLKSALCLILVLALTAGAFPAFAEEQSVGGKGTECQGVCKASGGLGRWQPRPSVVAAEVR